MFDRAGLSGYRQLNSDEVVVRDLLLMWYQGCSLMLSSSDLPKEYPVVCIITMLGRFLAAVSFDGTCSVWQRQRGTGAELKLDLSTTLEGHENEVRRWFVFNFKLGSSNTFASFLLVENSS